MAVTDGVCIIGIAVLIFVPHKHKIKDSSHGQAKNRPSENLQCKNPSFLTKWLDPLDLS